jgi:hypothetical protein
MLDFRKCAASATTCVALAVGTAAEAAVVNINYDLTASALHVNYDTSNGLDWYTSLPLALGGINVAAGDSLTVVVSFRNTVTNASQTLLLDQMGLGAATNAPATFGTPSAVNTGVHGTHNFGPSLTLVGSSNLVAGSADIDPTIASSALSAVYTGVTSSTCSSGTCNYLVVFPDLIDGFTTIGISGFSVTFGAVSATTQYNSLAFNLIAPQISVLQAAPEPGSAALLLAALAAAGAVARRAARASRC